MSNGNGLTFLTGWADLDYHDFVPTDHLNITVQDLSGGGPHNENGTSVLRGGFRDSTVTISGMTGGTFHFEISEDGIAWDTLMNAAGSAITFTQDGEYFTDVIGSPYLRIRAAAVTEAAGCTVVFAAARGR